MACFFFHNYYVQLYQKNPPQNTTKNQHNPEQPAKHIVYTLELVVHKTH